MPRKRFALLAATLAACLPSCSEIEPRGIDSPAGPADLEVVARFDDRDITRVELDAWIKDQLFEREIASKAASEQFERRSQAVAKMIDELLLAERAGDRGVSPETFVEQALEPIGDDDVAAFFEEHRARFGAGDTLEALAPRIREFLTTQRKTDVLAGLRKDADVKILMEPPRLEIAATGPARGPENAPITIVEFSDYQCPYCKRSEPVVESVLERYPERVRLVYRHFPLDKIHASARQAAKAAVCAEEQGQFWAYHAKIFENQGALAEADLEGYAGDLGLDLAVFRDCAQAERTSARVETDLAAGRAAGVTGTPAFFVNGIAITGARPLDDFVSVIDRELERQEADAAPQS